MSLVDLLAAVGFALAAALAPLLQEDPRLAEVVSAAVAARAA